MESRGNTTNSTYLNLPAYPFSDRSKASVTVELVVACILFVVGIAGNGSVCYVIYRSRYTKSSMYYFMASLAYADLLVCSISVPFTAISTRPQPLFPNIGDVACKGLRFFQYVLPPASVAILTATALDRYFHICHPLRFAITTKRTKQLTLCCWSYAALLTWPVILLLRTRPTLCHGDKECNFCRIKEASENQVVGSIYLGSRALIGFIIPEAVIIVLYYKVVKAVWGSKASRNKVKLNIIKSLAMVVLAFSLSWTPFSVATKYYLRKYPGQHKITTVELITFWIGLSASVYNPFIYAFYNRNFRSAFCEVFLGTKPARPGVTESTPSQPRPRPRCISMPDILDVIPKTAQAAPSCRSRALSFSDASSIKETATKSDMGILPSSRITANIQVIALLTPLKENPPKKLQTIASSPKYTNSKPRRTNSDPSIENCNESKSLLKHETPRKTSIDWNDEVHLRKQGSRVRNTSHGLKKKSFFPALARGGYQKARPNLPKNRPPQIQLAPLETKAQCSSTCEPYTPPSKFDLLQVPTRSDFC